MNDLYKKFYWACGIEDTFINDPHPQTKKRLIEYELFEHYEKWQNDFDLVSELGVNSLRWGIPWYKVNSEKNKWDFEWTDKAMSYLKEKNIEIILDLMHYGTPDWMENSFLNKDYPNYVGEYTERIIERYPYLKFITPFNETHTSCEFSGRRKEWPPYLEDYAGYVKIFKAIMYGVIKQMNAIEKTSMKSVHVECSGGTITDEDKYKNDALVETSVQHIYWDFLTGMFDEKHPIFDFLISHGIDDKDIEYFKENKKNIDVMGINFYPQFSYQKIYTDKNGETKRENTHLWTDYFEKLIMQRYEKYKAPIMITETSIRDNDDMRLRWIKDSSELIIKMRKEKNINIIGYTYFPVIDMYDWDYRIKEGEKENFEALFGLLTFKREKRKAYFEYQNIIKNNENI